MGLAAFRNFISRNFGEFHIKIDQAIPSYIFSTVFLYILASLRFDISELDDTSNAIDICTYFGYAL